MFFPGKKYTPVKKGGKYGVVDNSSNIIIPYKYDDASEFVAEKYLIKIKTGDKYGLVNKDDKIILEAIYDDLYYRESAQVYC